MSLKPSANLKLHWYKYSNTVGKTVWFTLKEKLTGRGRYFSAVNLGDADADILIENIKADPEGYPALEDEGQYEEYQKWLVERYLEQPFREKVNKKIEERQIESRLKEIQEQRKQKAQSFVSGSTSFRPGKTISLKTTKIAGIVPKRTIPQDIASKITPPDNTSESETESGQTITSKSASFSLGRLTLDLVQIGDNLDKIKEVIEEDYRQTKETNKKEIEEYRKRVANRGRKLPRKDLGDNKKDLKDIIKPFVGSFFSGMGGAIRSLAAFNLLDALVRGDWGQAFRSLMGIGITFLPQIGAMVAGAVLKSLLKGFGKSMVGGRAPVGPTRMAGGGGGPGVGVGKFGKMLALGTGALALGSAFAASQGEQSPEDESQTRLEEVTAEQKALTADGVGAITQDELKKFEQLNKKFEKAVDLLMGRGPGKGPGGGPGGTDASGAAISDEPVNMDPALRGTVTGPQFNNSQLIDLAKKVGATDEEAVRLAAIAKYESGGRAGAHNDSYLRGGSDNSYGLWQINMIGNLGPARMKEFGISSYDQLKDPVTNAQAALKVLRGSGWGAWTTNSKVTPGDLQEGRKNLQTRTPSPPPQPAAQPRPARNPEVSATPSSSGRSVAVVPLPVTGNDMPGSVNPGGSSEIASLDPGRTDYYSNKLVLGVIG